LVYFSVEIKNMKIEDGIKGMGLKKNVQYIYLVDSP